MRRIGACSNKGPALVSGPAGSGKPTALAARVKRLNKAEGRWPAATFKAKPHCDLDTGSCHRFTCNLHCTATHVLCDLTAPGRSHIVQRITTLLIVSPSTSTSSIRHLQPIFWRQMQHTAQAKHSRLKHTCRHFCPSRACAQRGLAYSDPVPLGPAVHQLNGPRLGPTSTRNTHDTHRHPRAA